MKKKLLILGVFLGMLSVILGAFGAHTLKKLISAEMIISFETGVRYQMYHALLLLIVANFQFLSQKNMKIIMMLIGFGILLFSGSIYFLATNELTSFNFKVIGFLTPIGGVLLILAWLYLLMQCLQLQKK